MVKFVTTELFFKSSVTRKLKMLHFSDSSDTFHILAWSQLQWFCRIVVVSAEFKSPDETQVIA